MPNKKFEIAVIIPWITSPKRERTPIANRAKMTPLIIGFKVIKDIINPTINSPFTNPNTA